MTLEKLAEEIASATKAEADAIRENAETEAALIIAEAEAEAKAIIDGQGEKASREASQLGMELVASAKQANQKLQLIARREELDATHEALKEQVGSAALKGRTKLLEDLLKKAKLEASKDMVLHPVSMDRKALDDAASGFKLGDDVEGLGGFILVSKDGAVSLDFRFDGILETTWDDKLGQVSAKLFN
ncbi:MAG: V-type ATP synthase subunit E family protein [Candidatus Poseidoniales archaeon]|jgi:V/A-type H+-transporting ATPase subunit E